MPIYEYSCDDCGHAFELMQSISDEPAKECPSCKRENVRKMISNSSFVLKGTGWYVTDYKKGSGSSDKTASSSATAPAPVAAS